MKRFIQKKILEKVCKKLYLAAAFVLLILFCVRFSVSANELRNLASASRVNVIYENQYEIPKEYHFSAQIQRDAAGNLLTEFVPFGDWDNEEKGTARISEESVVTRITGDRRKGNIGAWYYNVGKYQGKTVDLKCTVVDYEKLYASEDSLGVSIGWVAMSEEHIGLYLRHLNWAELKLEFYDAETGALLPIKSSAVITDVDAGEGMMVTSEYEALMVSEECLLEQTAMGEKVLFFETKEKEASDETKDTWAQVQVLFDGSSFQYRVYGNPESEWNTLDKMKVEGEENKTDVSADAVLNNASESLEAKESEVELKDEENDAQNNQEAVNGPTPPEFMFRYQGYSDCRLAPLTVGSGEMAVSDMDESTVEICKLGDREETFAYHMTYTVSPEYENWYYDSFVVTCRLADQLAYVSGNVCTDDGENVTSQFYLREEDGLIIFEAKQEKNKSFYGKTYHFTIEVKIKEGADIEPLWDGSYYVLPQMCQVEIQRDEKMYTHTTKGTSARLDTEYADGTVAVSLTDALSGVELTDAEVILLEWNEEKNAYIEAGSLEYSKEHCGYYLKGLKKTHNNQGKYKVFEKCMPQHYTGAWEREFQMTENQEAFTFEGINQPTGETLVRMTSVILKADKSVSEEVGSGDNPMIVERGDRIQYHIYVERDSALSFQSGELILKNKIPEEVVYEKDTLNLIGEIQHPVKNSTAKIASVRLNKEGELIWKVNHLDEGEIAHLLFEVSVPEHGAVFSDYSELQDGEKIIRSNTLEHQVKIPELSISVESMPDTDVIVHPREKIIYEITATNNGDMDAENVILRMFIPDGTHYAEDSLSCDNLEAKLHLAKETSEESDECKMVYGILSKLDAGESTRLKVQVYVDRNCKNDTVEAYGEIREVWQMDADLQQAALEKDGYKKSDSIVHKVEEYPDIEAPKQEIEDGASDNQENDMKEDGTSDNQKPGNQQNGFGGQEDDSQDTGNQGNGNKNGNDVILPDEINLKDSVIGKNTLNNAYMETDEKKNSFGHAVKTGDMSQIEIYFRLGGLALGSAVVACCFKWFYHKGRKKTING